MVYTASLSSWPSSSILNVIAGGPPNRNKREARRRRETSSGLVGEVKS